MKLALPEQSLHEASGTSGMQAFTVDASSSHIFDLLSSKLYSQPITAVMRELCNNAADSHVEAGKGDLPIEVKIPTSLDGEFYVRDFGLGLDHEEVTTLYTRYGASTKRNSNDVVGALGIGSKSPFAYSDTFTVDTIKNGVRRVYTAFKGNDGIPAIAKLHEEPTTDGNGVTVKLPVKRDDYYKFADAAQTILQWFKVPPNVLGAKMHPIETKEIAPGVNAVADVYTSFARMGNVAYPISAATLTSHKEFTRLHIKLLEYRLLLEVDIGDLSFTPSREELLYDERTRSALFNRVDAALKLIGARYLDALKDTTLSRWDRARKLTITSPLHFRDRELNRQLLDLAGCADPMLHETATSLMASAYQIEAHKPSQPVQVMSFSRAYTRRRNTTLFNTIANEGLSVPDRTIALNKPYAIYYQDVSYAQKRIRQDPEDRNGLLFIHKKPEIAKAMAEEYAKHAGGIRVIAVSACAPLQAVANAPTGSRTKSAPRPKGMDTIATVRVICLDNVSDDRRWMDDIPQSVTPLEWKNIPMSKRVYVVRYARRACGQELYRIGAGTTGDEKASTELKQKLHAIRHLPRNLIPELKNVVVIAAQDAARLMPENSGFKLLDEWIADNLDVKEVDTAVKAFLKEEMYSVTPSSFEDNMNSAEFIVRQMRQRKSLWDQMAPMLVAGGVIPVLKRIDAAIQHRERRDANDNLFNWLNACGVRHTAWEDSCNTLTPDTAMKLLTDILPLIWMIRNATVGHWSSNKEADRALKAARQVVLATALSKPEPVGAAAPFLKEAA